ncbi:histone-like nucleoid-structuring protein Lsr2 [Streptantibioticus parmotrematis]|uniref:Lsr2 family DNA-binding protein n=1 Tax=Streptantibioticus parmotrematis TaxID=2873249 RepID=UPI0033C3318C
MFNDPSAVAEGLHLHPDVPVTQQAAAARTVARHAHSKEDLALLLDAVGLRDDDTLTTPLPLFTSPEGDTHVPQQPPATANAFEAMALSMHHADHCVDDITAATGLSENEITALINTQERRVAADQTAGTVPGAVEAPTNDSVKQLLAWADKHPAAGIRHKAARVRSDLYELTTRRAGDDAQREAEEHVAKLKAELEKAQTNLRTLKAGHTTPAPAVTATTPIRPGLTSGRTREELTAIRTWARANGHQVASKGLVRKSVLEAYDTAHQTPTAKAG